MLLPPNVQVTLHHYDVITAKNGSGVAALKLPVDVKERVCFHLGVCVCVCVCVCLWV